MTFCPSGLHFLVLCSEMHRSLFKAAAVTAFITHGTPKGKIVCAKPFVFLENQLME